MYWGFCNVAYLAAGILKCTGVPVLWHSVLNCTTLYCTTLNCISVTNDVLFISFITFSLLILLETKYIDNKKIIAIILIRLIMLMMIIIIIIIIIIISIKQY